MQIKMGEIRYTVISIMLYYITKWILVAEAVVFLETFQHEFQRIS